MDNASINYNKNVKNKSQIWLLCKTLSWKQTALILTAPRPAQPHVNNCLFNSFCKTTAATIIYIVPLNVTHSPSEGLTVPTDWWFGVPEADLGPVFGSLPGPNRVWLLVVYFSRQASQLSAYQSCDYHVYIPKAYQTRPVSCSKTGLYQCHVWQHWEFNLIYNLYVCISDVCLLPCSYVPKFILEFKNKYYN